ncbi:MAG TPA: hypothetical protein PLU53_06335 [Bacteroidia bacterium]|nr:hypothetical protein [Bacteroidia bacterium]
MEDQIRKDYDKKSAKEGRELKGKLAEFDAAKKKFAEDKKKQDELVEKQVQAGLKAEKTKLEKNLRQQIDEDKSEQVKFLENEVKLKPEQVKELNKVKADMAKVQREKDELRYAIIAEQETKFNGQPGQER